MEVVFLNYAGFAALIGGEIVRVTEWCETEEEADDFLLKWCGMNSPNVDYDTPEVRRKPPKPGRPINKNVIDDIPDWGTF